MGLHLVFMHIKRKFSMLLTKCPQLTGDEFWLELSFQPQTDLKNKAINLCCDITKLFDEFNSKKRKTDKSWRNLNVNTQKLIGVMQHELNTKLKLIVKYS